MPTNRIGQPPRLRALALGAALLTVLAAPAASAQSSPRVLIAPEGVNLREGVPRALPIPSWYPSYFERAGVFQGLDEGRRSATIDAQRYPLTADFTVSTPLERSAAPHRLEPGMNVGMTVVQGDDDRTYLRRLWVLPDGLVQGDGDRYGLVVR